VLRLVGHCIVHSASMDTDGTESWARRGAPVVIPLLLLLSALCFVGFYSQFYPIKQWLFWRYAGYWIACMFWSVGCVSSGYALVRRLRGTPLPFAETLCLSFAAGVLLFYLAMNVLGAVHGLHGALFFALPLVMIAVGARSLWHYCRRYVRHARHAVSQRRAPSLLEAAIWTFGLAVLAMIYFQVLTPDNVHFDARWQHLPLAEQYAHLGFIPRFPEGWTVASNPHLAAILYTWAFLVPTGELFDQVALSAHLELTCFLWTIASIPPAVRLLVPGSKATSSWVARLLFPGVLLYDSSLGGGADHIGAVFALPIFITLLRALPTLPPGRCALLALMMAGAAMTKVTAGLMLVPGAALAVAAVVVWRGVIRHQLLWKPVAAATATALAATAFFWARNWIWYGDPVYPSLHEYFAPRPWTEDAANLFEWGYKEHQFWRPERSWSGVLESVEALFTFSFVPHDYGRFHGKVPVFGSLFTLLTLCLPFLKNTRRIWGLVALTLTAGFMWYSVHHQDRYLQTIVPWMAAVTAAIIIRIWQTNRLSRAALCTLIVAQVLIGADVYFIQSHAMIRSPIKRVADLLAAGHEGKYEQRLKVFPDWVAVRRALPDDAHVLLHDNHVHLGLSRRTTSDWSTWQYGISYGRLESPRQVWSLLRSLGVTHIVWQDRTSKGYDSVAGDLVFFDFVFRYAVDRKKVGQHWVARMPDEPPPEAPFGEVAFFGCDDFYATGLYRLSEMTVPVFGPKRRDFPQPLVAGGNSAVEGVLQEAHYVVVDPKCDNSTAARLGSKGFRHVANRELQNIDRKGRPISWKLYARE
jgi:hypothetical protein